jgi:hypothetical protein
MKTGENISFFWGGDCDKQYTESNTNKDSPVGRMLPCDHTHFMQPHWNHPLIFRPKYAFLSLFDWHTNDYTKEPPNHPIDRDCDCVYYYYYHLVIIDLVGRIEAIENVEQSGRPSRLNLRHVSRVVLEIIQERNGSGQKPSFTMT